MGAKSEDNPNTNLAVLRDIAERLAKAAAQIEADVENLEAAEQKSLAISVTTAVTHVKKLEGFARRLALRRQKAIQEVKESVDRYTPQAKGRKKKA